MKKYCLRILIMGSKFALNGLIIQMVLYTMVIASNGKAQNVNSVRETNITLRLNNVGLRTVFNEIESKTAYRFFYDEKIIDEKIKLSYNTASSSLADILLDISEKASLKFKQINSVINVIELKKEHRHDSRIEVILQTLTVTGRVTSMAEDEGLPGVNIVIKGTSQGVVSDVDGNYSINVPSKESVLVFSYVGFTSEEITVGNRAVINVSLAPDITSLQEVVVIGYGTQTKEELTAAISSVKSEDFIQNPAPDAAQLIRGQIAGLNVITPDANPLSTSQISLRGVTTLSSGASPLILIDGIPGSLNTVSPNDIAQIDVLKDGSAAAIYGTRGTNGVILITTKKHNGEIEPAIEINSYISTQKIIRKLPMMTADQYREKADQGKPGALDQGASVDWVDEILHSPFNQTYSVNLKGGSENTSYIASFDYTSNEGIVNRSKIDVIYPRLNVIHRMFDDKLTIDASVSGYHREYGIPYNNEVYNSAIIYNPTTPKKDENGNWSEAARDLYQNPLALLYETEGENKTGNLRIYSAATFSPIDNFDIKALASREVHNHFAGYYETKQHRSTVIQGRNGYASRTTERSQYDLMELTAQYFSQLGDGHNFNVLGGYSWIQNNFQRAFMDNHDFPTDDYTYNNIGLGAALREGTANQTTLQNEDKLVGYFGRVNYNYKARYYVSASIRHEGSSKFGSNHKWGNFPAISFAWNLTNEQFLENVDKLSFLKLRAGFGVTGTVPGSSYMSLNRLNFGGFGYYAGDWVNLLRPSSNPNPDLRWEKKEETNIGLDFGFFQDRLSGSIDVYRRDTRDLIYDYSVPTPPFLYSTITANAGSIRNQGVEVALNVVPVQHNDLVWNSNINFSSNKSKLLSLSNDKFISRGFDDFGHTLAPIQQATHRIQEGEPIGNFYGYKSIDIDENGHWIIEDEEGNPKPIVDQQPTDKKVLGNGLPKAYLNWNNFLTYKQFDIGVTMRGAFGFQILNSAEMNYAAPVALGNGNIMAKAYDNVYGKRPLADNQELQYVSYYIEDGDYWKIDNVTLGFSPALKSNPWIKSVRIYGSISNLAVITNYSGIDPEVNVQGLAPGNDQRHRYPSARTFTLGLNLKF